MLQILQHITHKYSREGWQHAIINVGELLLVTNKDFSFCIYDGSNVCSRYVSKLYVLFTSQFLL